MKFTVLIAVYNAPLATELTLRSLLNVADHHVSQILILDSSDSPSNILGHPKINYKRSPTRVLHHQAIHTLLQENIQTPYIFISDSDVEYYDCKHFEHAINAFENPQIAIAGEYIPKHHHPLGSPSDFFAPRIGPWAMFIKTDIAKMFKDNFLPKPPQVVNNETIHYDMGMPFFEALNNSGYKFMDIPNTSYHHFVARSRVNDILPELDKLNIPRENAYKPDEEIKKKLAILRG